MSPEMKVDLYLFGRVAVKLFIIWGPWFACLLAAYKIAKSEEGRKTLRIWRFK